MRRWVSKRAATAVAFASVAGVLAVGCGSSTTTNGIASKTPAEIVAKAKATADAARSVHVAGSLVNGGASIAFDLELLAGKGGRGRLSDDGAVFELIQTADTVYLKGSPAFYKHLGGNAVAQLLDGRWLKAPANSGEFASLSSLTNLRELFDTAFATHGTLTKGPTTTVAGRKVVGVSGSKEGTLYVATTGPAYPVEVAGTGSAGKISFNRWNKPVVLTPPANAIDIAQLQSAH